MDHPRLRGKNLIRLYVSACELGSPPLTREKHPHNSLLLLLQGITPAYAGKTVKDGCTGSMERYHPRLRGKNCKRRLYWQYGAGSPPLTREKLIEGVASLKNSGITPAYAGKTMLLYVICIF